ncbi:hypothetical protein [Amycolatopsis sp. NPDC051061]|uniref:WXG100 family type VII secretion target n=1 Tax=Amycolatopsis sp. NPDC051061 TaxID=3155042 RepID=UPI0034481675
MADRFRLDPAAVQDMVTKLGTASSGFSEAVAELERTLDRYDGCWGDDKAGKKFAEGYVENARQVRDGLRDVPGSVDKLTEGITFTVGEFQGLDEDNAKQYDHQIAESMDDKENK